MSVCLSLYFQPFRINIFRETEPEPQLKYLFEFFYQQIGRELFKKIFKKKCNKKGCHQKTL